MTIYLPHFNSGLIPRRQFFQQMDTSMIEYKPSQAIGASIAVGQNLAAGVYMLEVNQNGASKKVKITKL